MKALVFAFTYLCLSSARARLAVVATYIVGAKDSGQSVGVVGYYSSAVYEAHALGSRLGGHSILYATAEVFDGGGSGDVGKGHAALELSGRREDLEVDCLLCFGHAVYAKSRLW